MKYTGHMFKSLLVHEYVRGVDFPFVAVSQHFCFHLPGLCWTEDWWVYQCVREFKCVCPTG
jgi:hypothetical protein